MANYIQPSDPDFADQLRNFKTNIGSFPQLNLTATQVSGQAADSDYFNYLVACQQIMQNSAQQFTAAKNNARKGGAPTAAPAAPTFPAAVTAVAPGVEPRFRALCQIIKNSPAYTTAVGEALGIEAPQESGPDFSTLQPEIDVQINGNQVKIDWSWGGNGNYLDMIRLEVDRGDGKGFVFLANDTTPGYTDTTSFPAAPAKWTYRAIYMVADAMIGQWSKPVSVTVGG